MNFTVQIIGEQGRGVSRTGEAVSRFFCRQGSNTFNYREYDSLIEGGEAFNLIDVSLQNRVHFREDVDLVFLLKENIEKEKNMLDESAKVTRVSDLTEIQGVYRNSAVIGALAKRLGFDISTVKTFLKEEFAELDDEKTNKNLQAASQGYQAEEKVKELAGGDEMKLVTGSDGVVTGCLNADMDLYFAYPMTPATPVFEKLSALDDERLTAVQPGNEIAAVNMAIGSSHTGARSMVGTSGGGFDLMQETTSLQAVSEVPLVVYLAQRKGPGSGVPTYQEQADLSTALSAGHGSVPKTVFTPGNPSQAARATEKAFQLAEETRCLSIVLGDKHLAESGFSVESLPEKELEIERPVSSDSKPYKKSQTKVSPDSIPGESVAKSTSYEHIESGVTTEDPEKIGEMTERREGKKEVIEERMTDFPRVITHNSGANLVVVGWGSTYEAIRAATEDLDVNHVHINVAEPFPSEKVSEILDNSQDAVIVENNPDAQMSSKIREETGYLFKGDHKILKADGRPFGVDGLRGRIEEKLL